MALDLADDTVTRVQHRIHWLHRPPWPCLVDGEDRTLLLGLGERVGAGFPGVLRWTDVAHMSFTDHPQEDPSPKKRKIHLDGGFLRQMDHLPHFGAVP